MQGRQTQSGQTVFKELPDLELRTNRIWIAWQEHRRSREISRRFNADLFEYTSNLPRPLRYIVLIAKTTRKLLSQRGGVVFVQNPSMVLASLAVLLRPIGGYMLVVDRHTNFKLHTLGNKSIFWWSIHKLSKHSVRGADLTIVTNDFLANLVTDWGGRPFVLPDPIPDLDQGTDLRGFDEAETPQVTCICTFSSDEPVAELLTAVAASTCRFGLNITGRAPSSVVDEIRNLGIEDRVQLTGFLPEDQYVRLIARSDVIVVLTTLEHCLNCGAYEAVSLGRPMVLSDTEAIRGHFSKGAVYSQPDAESIMMAIAHALSRSGELASESDALRSELIEDWETRRTALEAAIEGLDSIGSRQDKPVIP